MACAWFIGHGVYFAGQRLGGMALGRCGHTRPESAWYAAEHVGQSDAFCRQQFSE